MVGFKRSTEPLMQKGERFLGGRAQTQSLLLTSETAANPVVVEEIDDVVVKMESQPATTAPTVQRHNATAQQLTTAAADATAAMSSLSQPAQTEPIADDRASPETTMHARQSA
ncbi:uncharacterized protein CCR75_002650 [Bremia lactucae]|uniref:Uncharacterized protein n=1 Tax=Bremia lactucae TaxID=4779 RepID=A0A976IBW7_BRELC|nr:hypothetical protein CCR75_002650 [Bremia lactucae]